MNRILLLIVLSHIFISCDNKSDRLYDKAMKLYHDVVVNNNYTEDNFQEISKLLEEAISIDKNNFKKYHNLTTIYINYGKYEKAVNLLLNMSDNNIGVKYKNIFLVGRIIEGIENRDSANYYYSKSILELNKMMPMDSANVLKISKATLILAKEGKNEALHYLDSLNRIYEDTKIDESISALNEFERKDIIELYIKDKEVD